MADEAEFDLNSLNDEELTEQVYDDLYNGLKAEVEQATRILLKRGWGPEKVLNDVEKQLQLQHMKRLWPTDFWLDY